MPRFYSAHPGPLPLQNGHVLSSSERVLLDELIGCDVAHEQEGRLVLAPASEQPAINKGDDVKGDEPPKPSVKKTTTTKQGA